MPRGSVGGTARRPSRPRGGSTRFGGHPAGTTPAPWLPRGASRRARPRGAPRPHLSPQAPTCGPLSPGDDVFPELPHRPIPGHLLVPRQALRQLDLRGKLHARNHGDNREDRRSPATPRPRLGARCDVTRARRPLPGALPDVMRARRPRSNRTPPPRRGRTPQ